MTKSTTNLNLTTYSTVEDKDELFYSYIQNTSASDVSNMTKIDDWIGSPHISGSAFTLGGLHVGGTSNPGTDNLIVDGKALISGSVTTAGSIVIGSATAAGGKLILQDSIGSFEAYTNSGSFILMDAGSGSKLIINDATGSYYLGCGTSNPTAKNIGDRFFRTDIGEEIYYAGSGSWLTTNTFTVSAKADDMSTNTYVVLVHRDDDYKPYVTKMAYYAYSGSIATGQTWFFELNGYHSKWDWTKENLAGVEITSGTTELMDVVVPSKKAFTNDIFTWGVSACKVGVPGLFDLSVTLYYKWLIE